MDTETSYSKEEFDKTIKEVIKKQKEQDKGKWKSVWYSHALKPLYFIVGIPLVALSVRAILENWLFFQ